MKITWNKTVLIDKLCRAAARGVAKSAAMLQREVKAKLKQHASNIGAGGIPSQPGEPPAKKTGALARSIVAIDATKDRFKPTWKVGTNLVYAKIQEYGGRIVPKKAKFLIVPIGLEGERALRSCQGNVRKLDLRVIRSKDGKLMLCRINKGTKKDKRASITPLFLLVKQVILPARPYLRPAYAEQKHNIRRIIAESMDSVFKGVA